MRVWVMALLAAWVLGVQAQDQPGIPVIHTSTSLVNVDVIVTDANNRPIHDLPASAFKIFEDERPQSISHFEEHRWSYAPSPAQPLAAGVFSNQRPPHDNTLNIVVLDALNTPVRAQMYAAEEIKRWVQNAPEGPEIAIVKLTTGLELVQGFTTDKRMLLDAVSRTKAVQSSILGPENEGRFGEIRARFRADYTNAAYKSLAHFAAAYPGKKNILWFTGGGYPAPRSGSLTDWSDPSVFEQSLAEAQQFLVDISDVSVYVIDSRGLETNAAYDASHAHPTFASANRWDENEIYREFNLLQMSDTFGGKVFINTNDLAGAMQDSIELGSNYYSLSYRPQGHDLDGLEHQIRIRVAGGQYRLGYRRSYLAVVRNAAMDNRGANKALSAPPEPVAPIHLAMGAGSPQLDGIVYQVQFVPAGKPGEVVNTLAQDSTKDPKLKSAFHNFNLLFAANMNDLSLGPAENGLQHLSVSFIVTTYDAHGSAQTSVGKTLTVTLSPDKVDEIKRTGHLDLTVPISIPAHGDIYVRTAVRDNIGGKIGTLEVPADMLNRLPAPQGKSE